MPTPIPATGIDQSLADLGTHALLDVRERGEYALGHLPGACPLPRGLLEVRIGALVPWTDVPVVVYCDDGRRSTLAAETLEQMGYRDVRVVTGGINAWVEAGNRPEEGVNVLGKTFGEWLSTRGGVHQIEPDQLAALQDEGDVLVIDARTDSEYRKGHVPGAVNIPGGDLASRLLSLPPEHTPSNVVVHCAGRTRSIVGADLVHALGFPTVYALRNGTMAWRMSGREVQQDEVLLDHEVTDEGRRRAAEFAANGLTERRVRAWTPNQVSEAIRAGKHVYLLDVRSAAEHRAGRPLPAIHCPVGQLANAADEELAVRDAVVVCCSNEETRSRIGARLLDRIGYPNVGWLEGGVTAWQQAGLAFLDGRVHSYPPELEAVVAAAEDVDPAVAEAWFREGSCRIIDVRRSSEFALEHIPGSTWVPRGDLETRLPVVLDQDGPQRVVLVSDRGVRAALAARTLHEAEMGGAAVVILAGGLENWKSAGLPTEAGLDGADVDLREAKEDAELVAPRPALLERSREDMVRYLTWEEQLGEAFEGSSHGG